jgi:glycosyltransferase involved in cell wall biosynthesis
MDAAGQGRVWLDVTTTSHAGGHYDGTTRIERSLIRELPAVLGPRLGFCVYDRLLGRFLQVVPPALPDAGAAHRSAGRKRRSGPSNAGRRIERTVRGLVKGAVARTVASADRARGLSAFPEAAAGDVLLLAGENWSRFDFAVLRRLKAQTGIKVAAVLQDMIPAVHPQFFDSAAFMERFGAYVDFLACEADLVLSISRSTTADFLKAAPQADPARVAIVQLGADPLPATDQARPAALAGLGERPFVISVSTIQARKNFDLLYRLWQKSAIEGQDGMPHLVIVGREGFGSADLLRLMRNDPWIAKTVTLLNTASDAELAWLYAHCAFTLYPSWYEGWGLPLSESLAYGKTFIASDNSSLPEAGQGLGIHLDAYDLIAWQREILRLTRDVETRRAMERRILAERKLPGWADCARDIADEIAKLQGHGQPAT